MVQKVHFPLNWTRRNFLYLSSGLSVDVSYAVSHNSIHTHKIWYTEMCDEVIFSFCLYASLHSV